MHRKIRNKWWGAVIVGMLAGWGAAPAATQLSNFSYAVDPALAELITNDPALDGSSVYGGQTFTTGTTASSFFDLQSVVLDMADAQPGTSGAFSVGIYSNNSGQPGTLLATLTGNSSPLTLGEYTYAVTSTLELAAGTTYWMVASAPSTTASGSGYGWLIAGTDGDGTLFDTQAVGWTTNISTAVAFGPNGSSWAVLSANDNGGNQAFGVNATPVAVPEPGAGAMEFFGAGVLGWAAWRRWRGQVILPS